MQVSPYYQIVGTNLQSQESIIDTYISKQKFVEENVKIKPTKDVYLRIRDKRLQKRRNKH